MIVTRQVESWDYPVGQQRVRLGQQAMNSEHLEDSLGTLTMKGTHCPQIEVEKDVGGRFELVKIL